MDDKDSAPGDSLAFLSANRAPGKRQIRVVNREELTSLGALIGGGSDDEDDDDFCDNQDHDDNSSNDGDSDGTNDNGSSSSDGESDQEKATKSKKKVSRKLSDDEEDSDDVDESSNSNSMGVADSLGPQNSGISTPRELQQDLAQMDSLDSYSANAPICCLCLNFNHGENEVIQCDNCGLTVHEGCYGIGDDGSVSSMGSLEATEPWFCEPCLAGYKPSDLDCELCPAKGGAFKRIDHGDHWVHLLCALYVSNCTFGDLERLSPVCVFDVGYNRFGSKTCVGCQKQGNRLAARTGICSKCDAGMCKVYYHITCAQKAGLLVGSLLNASIDSSGEHAAADPYFFCCPAHSDRQAMKMKAKRFQLLQQQQSTSQPHQLTPREQRVLAKRRDLFARIVAAKRPHWMPTTEKWQRLLPTSSKYFTKLGRKAEASEGITREEWEGEFRVSFTADMMGKFVMPPAFSSDFVTYFSEREKMLPVVRNRLQELTDSNNAKRTIQENLKRSFDKLDEEKHKTDDTLKEEHGHLSSICSNLKQLGCKQVQQPKPLPVSSSPSINGMVNSHLKSSSTDTPSKQTTPNGSTRRRSSNQRSHGSASRASMGALRKSSDEPPIDIVRVRQCAECEQSHDQHLMAHCDTCGKHYHISCLDPPLAKLPKKTSLFGWECSKCFDPSPNHSDAEADVNAPRQLRAKRKPVVRFTSDEIFDGTELNHLFNGVNLSRRVAPKRKSAGSTQSSPAIKKHCGPETKKLTGSPSVGETDHAVMARDVDKAVIYANIEKCVDAVVKRCLGERRSSDGQYRPKKESVTETGLEDENDDESRTSEESVELHGNIKHPKNSGSSGTGLGAKRRSSHSAGQKRENDVQVIRVEDLE